MPTIRCFQCGHQQAVEHDMPVACAKCGAAFLAPPQSSTPYVVMIALWSLLGTAVMIVFFILYFYLQSLGGRH